MPAMNKAPLRILLHGPYGGLNLGDDAIASTIVDRLQGDQITITLSAPVVRQTTIHGRITLPAPDLRHGQLGTLRCIGRFDAVVIGGGEQLSEPRLPNPVWGHLATVVQLTLAAKLKGVPSAWFAVGVDARLSVLGRLLIRMASTAVRYISVRDTESLKRLRRILSNSPGTCVTLGADPVFLETPPDPIEARKRIRPFVPQIEGDRPIALIIPTNDRFHSLQYLQKLRTVSDRLAQTGMHVVYAISDLQRNYDLEIYENDMLPTGPRQTWASIGYDWNRLRDMIASASFIISSRMHPLIAAAGSGTPFYCIARSAKMTSLMHELKHAHWSTINELDTDELSRIGSTRTVNSPPPAIIASVRRRAALQFEELRCALLRSA